MSLSNLDIIHLALGLSLALWGLAAVEVALGRPKVAPALLGASCGACLGVGLAGLLVWLMG